MLFYFSYHWFQPAMNFCMKPSAPTHWWKDTCLGCGTRASTTTVAMLETKRILCPACAERQQRAERHSAVFGHSHIEGPVPRGGILRGGGVCGKPKQISPGGLRETRGGGAAREFSAKECNRSTRSKLRRRVRRSEGKYYSIQCTKHSSATFTMVSEEKCSSRHMSSK